MTTEHNLAVCHDRRTMKCMKMRAIPREVRRLTAADAGIPTMSAISIPCPACGQGLKIRDRGLLGRRAKCPKCGHSFLLEVPGEEIELHLAGTRPASAAASAPTAVPAPPATEWAAPPSQMPVAAAPTVAVPAATSSVARMRQQRRKSRKGYAGWVIGIGVVGFAALGGYAFYQLQQQSVARPSSPGTSGRTASSSPSDSSGRSVSETVTASPTNGAPISLAMIPAGARTLVHLRPSELWTAGSPGEEFRYCLGPLGVFLDQQIQAICKRPASDIEELLIAWIPGQRGTPPDWAAVVRLKTEAKKSELLDIVGGMVVDSYGHPVYIDDDRAGVIVDLKTYAMGPAAMAEDMVLAIKGNVPMPIGIEALTERTDRQRHISVMFEPTAMLLDLEFMAPAAAQPLVRQFMDWFGNDVETVLWSMHLEKDRFFSDLQVRNMTTLGTLALEDNLKRQLAELPKQLVDAVRMMQPTQLGRRSVIGRFPAMMKVVSMATVSSHGPRHVEMVTSLPDRAAPNLALGALLAWDESTRTDFTRQMPTMPSPDSSAPAIPIADRLKTKFDVDFRRTPLQEAIAFIGDETKVEIKIDGDALKLSGYTQNMPQSFKIDQATGIQALHEIMKQYDKMCLVVNEASNQATVMTFPVAEQRGLQPFPLAP